MTQLDKLNVKRELGFNEGALCSSILAALHFKCEDFREDGCQIGSLYATLRDRSEVCSKKYVTLADAKEFARLYGVALVDS